MKWKNPFSKFDIVKCPGDSDKRVYKNPNDAYPLAIKAYEANISAKTSSVLTNSARISGKFRKKVAALLVDLGQNDGTLIIDYRAAYVVFQSDPCKYSDYLVWKTNLISAEHQRLKRLNLKIRAFMELANDRNTSSPEKLAADIKTLENFIRHPNRNEIEKEFELVAESLKSSNDATN